MNIGCVWFKVSSKREVLNALIKEGFSNDVSQVVQPHHILSSVNMILLILVGLLQTWCIVCSGLLPI